VIAELETPFDNDVQIAAGQFGAGGGVRVRGEQPQGVPVLDLESPDVVVACGGGCEGGDGGLDLRPGDYDVDVEDGLGDEVGDGGGADVFDGYVGDVGEVGF